MVSVHDKWIRIFDIPDIRKHKSGFTIYKVVSMVRSSNLLYFCNNKSNTVYSYIQSHVPMLLQK